MTELLAERDAIDAAEALSGVEGTYERAQLERSLRREVAGMWGSDELRRSKPTPQKEARGGLAVLETALWDAVPGYVRRLDAVVAEKCGAPLPLGAAPVVFASWMGGDRDGNPNVTAQVTREVVAAQRRQAAALYLREVRLRSRARARSCRARVSHHAHRTVFRSGGCCTRRLRVTWTCQLRAVVRGSTAPGLFQATWSPPDRTRSSPLTTLARSALPPFSMRCRDDARRSGGGGVGRR